MPDTKKYCPRVKNLAGLFRSEKGVFLNENFQNVCKLYKMVISPIRDMIIYLEDLFARINEHYVGIVKMRVKFDISIIFLFAENDFPHFIHPPDFEEIRKVRYALWHIIMLTRSEGNNAIFI